MGLLLEAFDAGVAVDAALPGPSADWCDGHGAGLAEGLALGREAGAREAETRSAMLSADLAQALSDMAFSYAEARGQVLLSLRPLLATLADRLLPALAAEALAPWLVEALLDAARADSARPLLIHVHPDRLDALRPCLPPGGPASLRADPAMGPHDARLEGPGHETVLDLGACLAGLRDALLALTDDPARKARHA